MSIRRNWTVEQDKVLKLLKQERKIKKWSSIAKIMDYEFNMCGRNGKQCRERYNNHLHDGIVENRLSLDEQKVLENLNDQIGNKWSVIAKAFKGRTANFLKNQLYSKLRKSIRKLNKFTKEMKMKEVKPFKLSIVYKIVQTNDFKIFQKQHHSLDDLTFYSQLKEQLFRYAQKPLSQIDLESVEQFDLMRDSRNIIQKLNEFQKMYDKLNKKTKKPRKRYFCQDDIILNSLSNNKTKPLQSILIHQHNQQENENQQSSEQSMSQSQSSSLTSDKKQSPRPQTNKLQIKQYQSRHFQIQKDKDLFEFQRQTQPKTNQKSTKIQKDLQLSANHNCKIVEQGDIQYHSSRVNLHLCKCLQQMFLEQSEQCQFIDAQYLDHFKSCSMIDQSLFQ